MAPNGLFSQLLGLATNNAHDDPLGFSWSSTSSTSSASTLSAHNHDSTQHAQTLTHHTSSFLLLSDTPASSATSSSKNIKPEPMGHPHSHPSSFVFITDVPLHTQEKKTQKPACYFQIAGEFLGCFFFFSSSSSRPRRTASAWTTRPVRWPAEGLGKKKHTQIAGGKKIITHYILRFLNSDCDFIGHAQNVMRKGGTEV